MEDIQFELENIVSDYFDSTNETWYFVCSWQQVQINKTKLIKDKKWLQAYLDFVDNKVQTPISGGTIVGEVKKRSRNKSIKCYLTIKFVDSIVPLKQLTADKLIFEYIEKKYQKTSSDCIAYVLGADVIQLARLHKEGKLFRHVGTVTEVCRTGSDDSDSVTTLTSDTTEAITDLLTTISDDGGSDNDSDHEDEVICVGNPMEDQSSSKSKFNQNRVGVEIKKEASCSSTPAVAPITKPQELPPFVTLLAGHSMQSIPESSRCGEADKSN